ncbi:MAG: DNA primase [Clostridium sp.]|nr:DNA primase [Clostridium sp.]
MFSEEVIQRIKSENDIVDVVSEVVTLKKAGRNYLGRCPFHNEKTPSFTVSSEKQIYKCFGCGEAGNVISFVMKTKNLNFPEAVKYLAERVNIPLEEEDDNREKSESREKYKRMYDLNVQAGRYYYTNLKRSKAPYEYLKNRGITDDTIKKFGLGYALEGWQNVRNYLKQRGFSEDEILTLGLTTKNDKGNIYDRFRNRIIFPVFDVNGRVIGFGGRVLDDSKPKYLNSPETPIFHKGTNLYGLNLAVKHTTDRTIIMVEGYMDVISLSQGGVGNVVATLGTALTEAQCRLLKRYVDTVVVSFDADIAGQKATSRSITMLQNVGFDIRILQIPQGKDPDEYMRVHGKEEFIRLVDAALPIIDYKLKKAEEGIDFSRTEMRVKYLKNVVPILKKLDSLERAVYVKQISEKSGVGEDAVLRYLTKDEKKDVKIPGNHNINIEFGQKLYLEPAFLKASRTILSLALNKKINLNEYNKIEADDFTLQSHKIIFELIKSNDQLSKDELKNYIDMKTIQDSNLTKEWINIGEYKNNVNESSLDKLINDCIKEIKKYKLEESMKNIMSRIRECESRGLVEESLSLAMRLMDIQKEMKDL